MEGRILEHGTSYRRFHNLLARRHQDFACHLAQIFDYNAPVRIIGLFVYRRLTRTGYRDWDKVDGPTVARAVDAERKRAVRKLVQNVLIFTDLFCDRDRFPNLIAKGPQESVQLLRQTAAHVHIPRYHDRSSCAAIVLPTTAKQRSSICSIAVPIPSVASLFHEKEVLSHLQPIPPVDAPKPFAYDNIKALDSVKESRSAEIEIERMALAKCLAQVLPIHLDLFPTDDLANLIPFLPPSEYVPSVVFLHQDSANREDLSALAYLQIASCKGRPSQTAALVTACVNTTRWLFERPHTLDSVPNKQPLHLISKPGTHHYLFQHCNFSSSSNKHSPGALEALIDTLSVSLHISDQRIKTTHTSRYYWFLVLSTKILTQRSISDEMLARHSYILRMIADRLSKRKEGDYLFHTTSIYAGIIATSSEMRLSLFWDDFLRAVNGCRGDFPRDAPSQLCKELKADEAVWANIDGALKALGSSDIAFVSDSHVANDTMVAHQLLAGAHGRDPSLGEGGGSGGRAGDAIISFEATA